MHSDIIRKSISQYEFEAKKLVTKHTHTLASIDNGVGYFHADGALIYLAKTCEILQRSWQLTSHTVTTFTECRRYAPLNSQGDFFIEIGDGHSYLWRRVVLLVEGQETYRDLARDLSIHQTCLAAETLYQNQLNTRQSAASAV